MFAIGYLLEALARVLDIVLTVYFWLISVSYTHLTLPTKA